MSYDLYFWREDSPQNAAPADICRRLCVDEDLEGIAELRIDAIKAQFAAAFPNIKDNGPGLDWEGAASYFQVSWSIASSPQRSRCISVNCGWPLLNSPEVMNQIIDVGNALGCALYDPQTGVRYPQPNSGTS